MAKHILTDEEWKEYQELKQRFIPLDKVKDNQIPGMIVAYYAATFPNEKSNNITTIITVI